MKDFSLYTVEYNDTHLKAFEKIEKNRKCFLIVLKKGNVVGTFTDGDVRRAFLRGGQVSDTIEKTYNPNFVYVEETSTIFDVIDRFKQHHIEFLPVIGNDGSLFNIITKDNLQWLLLQGKFVDIDYDFLSIEDMWDVKEVYLRPWGFYKSTVLNPTYQSKIISISPGASLSLQKHMRREEYWIVIHGNGVVRLGDSEKQVSSGTSLFIPKNCLHRIRNTSQTEPMLITEVQLGDYFGEDDIIRYEDDYGRA